MREAEGEFDNLSFDLGLVTDADELLPYFVSLRYADHHVMDKRTVETMHGAVAGLVRRTCHCQYVPLYGDLDVRVYLLAQFAQRSFHAYHVLIGYRHGNPGGQVYR